MATYTSSIVACFAVLCHIQIINGEEEDATYSGCLPRCARTYIPLIKQQLAARDNLKLVESEMSPYPAGNQCWDCGTTRRVWNSVSRAGSDERRRRRHVYNFDEFPTRKWPLTVDYIFNDTVPTIITGTDVKAVVRDALSHLEARTCIRFNEISQHSSSSHISFGLGTGCVAFVGRPLDTPSSPIFATADCFKQFGEMLYLVAQNLGMWHVTQRYDRDSYVQVVTSNLLPAYQPDLSKLDPSSLLIDTFQLPYDYASLMHFPPKVYSANGDNTIDTLDALYNRTIGQRVQLSFLDTKLLNLAYCSGSCSGQQLSSACEHGGYQDPNDCRRCVCPDGFGGDFCTDLEPSQGARCGGVLTATTTQQTITSPGYNSPGYYDSQIKCIWRIQSSSGTRHRLRFVGEFGVFCKESACYHWVEVRYTGRLNDTGPRFCCSDLPHELISSSNETLIIFQSNMSDVDTAQRRGFQLAYSIVTTDDTETSTTSSMTSSPTDDVCQSNPCHNHGRCRVDSTSSTGFACSCPRGLWGSLCQQGCCGGCGARPGIPVQPCTAQVYPPRMCNVTMWYPGSWRRGGRGRDHWDSSDHDRRKRHLWPRKHYEPRTVEVPCTFKFCCDNAQRVGVPNVTHLCAVAGWTNWSRCSASSCGGGRRQRVLYEIETRTSYSGQTVIRPVAVNRTTELCNTDVCDCDSASHPRWGSSQPRWGWDSWRHWWCSPCNWGFQEENGSCVPTR